MVTENARTKYSARKRDVYHRRNNYQTMLKTRIIASELENTLKANEIREMSCCTDQRKRELRNVDAISPPVVPRFDSCEHGMVLTAPRVTAGSFGCVLALWLARILAAAGQAEHFRTCPCWILQIGRFPISQNENYCAIFLALDAKNNLLTRYQSIPKLEHFEVTTCINPLM